VLFADDPSARKRTSIAVRQNRIAARKGAIAFSDIFHSADNDALPVDLAATAI
jgi:hypothetical protein